SGYSASAVTALNPSLAFNTPFGTDVGNQLDLNWATPAGDFTVSGTTATGFGSVSARNIAVLNGTSIANSTPTVTVTNLTTSGELAELVANYRGSTASMYQGGIRNTNGVYTAELYRVVGSTQTSLGAGVVTLTQAQFNGTGTIKLQVSGSTIK